MFSHENDKSSFVMCKMHLLNAKKYDTWVWLLLIFLMSISNIEFRSCSGVNS